MGVNSLPKTVTRQRRGCDLIPGPFAPESSTLTTRLPSHPFHYYTNTKPGNMLTSVWTAENMLDSRHIRVRINCVRGRDPRKSGVVRWKSVMARGSRSAPPAYFLSGHDTACSGHLSNCVVIFECGGDGFPAWMHGQHMLCVYIPVTVADAAAE